MATLSVRFRGMCAFVSDNVIISKATQLNIVMPDVFRVLKVDPHHPVLTFPTETLLSGGASALTIRTPNGDFSVWSFEQRKLKLATPSKSAFMPKNLESIASIKEGGYHSEVIDDNCLTTPRKNDKPVSALMEILEGTVSCPSPGEGDEFAKEVLWSLEFQSDQVTFGLLDLDAPYSSSDYSETVTLKIQESTFLEITNISVQSMGPNPADHFEAYGALLKDSSREKGSPQDRDRVGPGVGCQPTKMVTEEAV